MSAGGALQIQQNNGAHDDGKCGPAAAAQLLAEEEHTCETCHHDAADTVDGIGDDGRDGVEAAEHEAGAEEVWYAHENAEEQLAAADAFAILDHQRKAQDQCSCEGIEKEVGLTKRVESKTRKTGRVDKK